MNVARAESGMDRKTASGGAEIAEENDDHQGRSGTRPMAPSCSSVLDGRLDEDRLIEDDIGDERLWHIDQILDHIFFTPLTIAMVLASPPCLSTGR